MTFAMKFGVMLGGIMVVVGTVAVLTGVGVTGGRTRIYSLRVLVLLLLNAFTTTSVTV